MASDIKVSVKDQATATAWLTKVTVLNEDYHAAMQEAGETLTDMQNFADGTMVDEFVNLGSTILTAAETTFNAINAIGETVNTVLGFVTEFSTSILGGIGKALGMFGG